MKNKVGGVLEIMAALVVLFSSLWDPRVSIIVAVAALVIFGVIKLLKNQPNEKVEEEKINQQ